MRKDEEMLGEMVQVRYVGGGRGNSGEEEEEEVVKM